MSNKKRQNDQTTPQNSTSFPLRLAIATATLGMTMGVSLSDALATPRQLEQGDQQIATSNLKYERTQKPGVTQAKPIPAVSQTKIKQPGKAYPKVERTRKAYPKVERTQ